MPVVPGPSCQTLGTELLETASGHLMIPVQGQLTDLSGLRQRAEERYKVALPVDAPTLLDLLSTPGHWLSYRSPKERWKSTRQGFECVSVMFCVRAVPYMSLIHFLISATLKLLSEVF